MSDENKGPWASFWASILSILDKDQREIIGVLVALAAFSSWGYLPIYLKNLTEKKEACWDLRSIDGKTYKFNRCTGESVLLESPKTSSITR